MKLREKIINELEKAYGKIEVDTDTFKYPLSHEATDQILALFLDIIGEDYNLEDATEMEYWIDKGRNKEKAVLREKIEEQDEN